MTAAIGTSCTKWNVVNISLSVLPDMGGREFLRPTHVGGSEIEDCAGGIQAAAAGLSRGTPIYAGVNSRPVKLRFTRYGNDP